VDELKRLMEEKDKKINDVTNQLNEERKNNQAKIQSL
jgi:hypothetical protein